MVSVRQRTHAACLQLKYRSFNAWRHRISRFGRIDRISQQLVQIGIGVVGVMVERHESFHAGQCAEIQRLIDRTMPPSTVAGIFICTVLAVVNQQIRVSCQRSAGCPFARQRRKTQRPQCRFMVGQVGQHTTARRDDSIAQCRAGMTYQRRGHAELADVGVGAARLVGNSGQPGLLVDRHLAGFIKVLAKNFFGRLVVVNQRLVGIDDEDGHGEAVGQLPRQNNLNRFGGRNRVAS